MFNEGRTNVHDEERSGRPSLITEDFKKQIDEQIRQDRSSTLDEMHEKFPQITRSVLHEILSKHLGYKKNLCKVGTTDAGRRPQKKNAWALH
jgi:transposase